MNILLIATKNKGKVKEIKEILKLPVSTKILSLLDLKDIPNIEETGKTYQQNANIKAQAIYEKFKIPVLAEDSGIEFLFFGRMPGIYSSRFLGEDTDYQEKNNFIMNMFKYLPDNLRKCHYVSNTVLIINNEQIYETVGICDGIIAKKPAGKNGFGYDPIFYLPQYKKTMAQISTELKNKISHRAMAILQIKKILI